RPPHHNPVETDPHPSPRLRSPRPQNRRVGRTRCARRVTSMTCAHKHRKFGLAHTIGNKAEAAYRRGDALEKRRAMMEAWAQWCELKAGNVLPFAKPVETA